MFAPLLLPLLTCTHDSELPSAAHGRCDPRRPPRAWISWRGHHRIGAIQPTARVGQAGNEAARSAQELVVSLWPSSEELNGRAAEEKGASAPLVAAT